MVFAWCWVCEHQVVIRGVLRSAAKLAVVLRHHLQQMLLFIELRVVFELTRAAGPDITSDTDQTLLTFLVWHSGVWSVASVPSTLGHSNCTLALSM